MAVDAANQHYAAVVVDLHLDGEPQLGQILLLKVPHRFKARSSNLRTASGRVGESACFLIQASSLASCFGCKRTWTCVPLPVGAGPRFRGTNVSCFMLITVVPQYQLTQIRATG